jgi:hypothetical protein
LDVNGYPSPTTSTEQTSEDDLERSEESKDIRDDSALPECNDRDDFIKLDIESLFTGDWTSDLEGGSERCGSDDIPWVYSDSVWDSEFEGFFDSDDERQILEDVEYLEAVRHGRLAPDGSTQDDNQRDADIQAFFHNVLQTFHTALNEISSILQFFCSLLDVIQATSNT